MASSVIILLGSPRRNGNSAALADCIASGARQAGARVDSEYVHGQRISPCLACYACQKPGAEGCAVDDDMTALYAKLQSADAWVVATPVYWFSMSAQTKLWIDRCFALTPENSVITTGKRAAVAMTFHEADLAASGGDLTLKTFEAIFRHLNMDWVGAVYGQAQMLGAIARRDDLCRQAEELGRRLAGPPETG